jgi:hypothetical protein
MTSYKFATAISEAQSSDLRCHSEERSDVRIRFSFWQSKRSRQYMLKDVGYGFPRQCAHWLGMTYCITLRNTHSTETVLSVLYVYFSGCKSPTTKYLAFSYS